MNKKQLAKIIASIFLILLVIFAYDTYQKDHMKNYYKTFYSNLEKGDVTSNECLKAWNSFLEDPTNTLTFNDHLYDYNKKRCLLFTRQIGNNYDKVYDKEIIIDLITNKTLFSYEDINSNSISVKDYENDKQWNSSSIFSGDFPFADFDKLKNLVK